MIKWLKLKSSILIKKIDDKMRTNQRSRKMFAILGLSIAMIHFWMNDLFSAVNFQPFEKIAMSHASVGAGLELYMTGLGFTALYAIIGSFAAILGSELFILICEATNWRPRIYKSLVKDDSINDSIKS